MAGVRLAAGRRSVGSSGSFDGAKVLRVDSVSARVVRMEYAVRGPIAVRADALKKHLDERPGSLPFERIISCNIGNPQQLQQAPISFYRQVSALVECPDLLAASNSHLVGQIFPPDAVLRARELVDAMGGSSGAYSHSQGIPLVRQRVADFIASRDGFPANPDNIFLTAGASAGVQTILQTIIADKNVGIMIPIPQYPLYTASIAMYEGTAVPYYLDESKAWGLSTAELARSLAEARSKGVDVRALCVINPGNPTGQCLSFDNMRDIIAFCVRERLVLLADEVYQVNIYMPEQLPFHSFKKVRCSMGADADALELVSFHSVSKGTIGECGRRGGYYELVGIDPAVQDMLYKLASVSLCPPVQGQLILENMVNPPKPGDPSYDLHQREHATIYASLKRRALHLADAFNSLEGVTCNPAEGALYLFPRLTLPQKAIDAAHNAGTTPDAMYSMQLLDATGVCTVPGSGFGQEPNTYHIRSTFLPPEHQMDQFISSIKSFHQEFMKTYQ